MTLTSWIAGGVSLALALLLAALWRRAGWGDASAGAERARKLQRSAVPAVGGFAILAGWAALIAMEDTPGGSAGLAWPGSSSHARILIALLVAFGAGALDDALSGGLRPRTKLGLQTLAVLFLVDGVALAAGITVPDPKRTLIAAGIVLFVGVGAQNALNTFDNADGAATGVAASGLLVAGSPLAPAVLLFLVPNLLLRRRASSADGRALPWRGRDPLAYLGDGGSQLLGLVLLLAPGARLALLIPVLDLVRVALARTRAGEAFWVGDRRHLAHRLQRAGLGPLAVVGALVGLGLPALVWPGWGGAAASAGLYLAGVLLTRPFAAQDAVRGE